MAGVSAWTREEKILRLPSFPCASRRGLSLCTAPWPYATLAAPPRFLSKQREKDQTIIIVAYPSTEEDAQRFGII